MSCIRLAYVATVLCLFQSVKATWEGNLTNTTNATNEVLKVVQLPYPEFEKFMDNAKAMELQQKISKVRARDRCEATLCPRGAISRSHR